MDRFAQKRTRRSKAWEWANVSGRRMEGMHPEAAAIMGQMRTLDDEIREIAQHLKPAFRLARSAARRREYLEAAHACAGFHERMRVIVDKLKKFHKTEEVSHFNYLLNNFDSSKQKQLFTYNPNAEMKEACNEFDTLVKESGISDMYHFVSDWASDTGSNLFTGKGWARRSLEGIFDKSFLKTLATGIQSVVNDTGRMLNQLITAFDEMESGISRRKIGTYLTVSKKLVANFENYHTKYMEYDKNLLTPFREHQAAIKAKEEKQRAEEAAKEETAKQQQAAQHNELQELKNLQKQPERIIQRQEPPSPPANFSDTINKYREDIEKSVMPSQNSPDSGFTYVDDLSNRLKQNEFPKSPRPFSGQPQSSAITEDDDDFTGPLQFHGPVQEKPNVPPPPQYPVRIREDDDDFTGPLQFHGPVQEKQVKPKARTRAKPKPKATPKAAVTQQFIDQLTTFANSNDISSFVNSIINYSEQLEDTDPEASGHLLIVANDIIGHQKVAIDWSDKLPKSVPGIVTEEAQEEEPPTVRKPEVTTLPRLEVAEPIEIEEDPFTPRKPSLSPPPSAVPETPRMPPSAAPQETREIPEELQEQEENIFNLPELEIPTGFFSQIDILNHIKPSDMKISVATRKKIIEDFAHRLMVLKKVKSISNYANAIRAKLIPLLLHNIYNKGLVTDAASASDTHNPNDQKILVYTRVDLTGIASDLTGTVGIYVLCRVSARHKSLTVERIKNNFSFTENQNTKSILDETSDDEDNKDFDEDDGRFDEYPDQYDLD